MAERVERSPLAQRVFEAVGQYEATAVMAGSPQQVYITNAVLDVLDAARVLCASEYQDPIGGWHICERSAFHEGIHENREMAWPDDAAHPGSCEFRP